MGTIGDGRLKLGIGTPYVDGVVTTGPAMREYAQTVEACGVESVWTVEHVIEADDYEPRYSYSATGHMPARFIPMADPLEILAFYAGCTSTITLGTAVMVAPLHSPVVLAKRVATLANLSGDRLVVGLGIGWQKEEYASVGVPYADRGARLDECIDAMRVLWADRPATYHGRFVTFDAVHLVPPPPRPTIPIILGGNTPPAIARAARVADGWYPHAMPPDQFAEAAAFLRDEVRQAGRKPEDVPISVTPASASAEREMDVDWVQQYVTHGATRLVIRPGVTSPDGVGAVRDKIDRYREQVLDRLVVPDLP